MRPYFYIESYSGGGYSKCCQDSWNSYKWHIHDGIKRGSTGTYVPGLIAVWVVKPAVIWRIKKCERNRLNFDFYAEIHNKPVYA